VPWPEIDVQGMIATLKNKECHLSTAWQPVQK